MADSGSPFILGSSTPSTQLNTQDVSFLQQAGALGLSEIGGAKIALDQSTDPATRVLAHWALTDHASAAAALQALGQQSSTTVPATLTSDQADALRSLVGSSGTGGDQGFTYLDTSNLQSEVELYQQEISSGKDPAVVSFATQALPLLQAQLNEAQTLGGAAGATTGAAGNSGVTGGTTSADTTSTAGGTTSGNDTATTDTSATGGGAASPGGTTSTDGSTTTSGASATHLGRAGCMGGGTFPAGSTTLSGGAAGSGAGAPGSTTSPATRTGSPVPGPLNPQDTQFIQQAAAGGVAEVDEGNLAATHASSHAVAEFGRWMVADHTAVNAVLASVAQQNGVTPPTTLPQALQQEVSSLQSLSGSEFDQAYTKAEVSGHATTMMQFLSEAASGENPTLVALAKETLPILQQHLTAVSELALNQVGAAPLSETTPTMSDIVASLLATGGSAGGTSSTTGSGGATTDTTTSGGIAGLAPDTSGATSSMSAGMAPDTSASSTMMPLPT